MPSVLSDIRVGLHAGVLNLFRPYFQFREEIVNNLLNSINKTGSLSPAEGVQDRAVRAVVAVA